MTMIAPYGQATLSSAYQDGCRMLQTPDIQPLNVNDRPATIVLRDATNKDNSSSSESSSTMKNDKNVHPRRKGILTRGKEQREPCSPPVLSSEEQQGTKRNNKVSFYESVHCLLVVPSRSEYTRDEVRRLWYVDQEYKTIKNDIMVTLKQMMKTFPASENEQMCYRGLEFRTKEGALLKTLRRENAYDAVLGEQARQYLLELNEPSLIATMYSRATSESCQEAILRAQKDATQCSMFLMDDKRRTASKRKQFFGLPRDGINRAFDPSSKASASVTRRNK